MAARKTTKFAAAEDADGAKLEEFYMRVMRRVCRRYRERSGNGDAAALLERQWTKHLTSYTGGVGGFAVGEDNDTILDMVDPNFTSLDQELDALLPGVFEPTVADLSAQVGGHGANQGVETIETLVPAGQPFPRMQHDALPTPSVFAKMLGTKRPLSQLDGPADDSEAAGAGLPDIPDPRRRRVEQASASFLPRAAIADDWEAKQPDASDFDPSTSTLVETLEPTSELLPVSTLSVNQFPLQLSAYYSKFGYRSKLQGYAGEVHAAILTIPAPIDRPESVVPGHLLWRSPTDASSMGGMVEVINRDAKQQHIQVKTASGSSEVMSIADAFRLKECIIPKGTVCFRE